MRAAVIRQWCEACQRATPTITLSNSEQYCEVCGVPDDDDYEWDDDE